MDQLPVFFLQVYPQEQDINQHILVHTHSVNHFPQRNPLGNYLLDNPNPQQAHRGQLATVQRGPTAMAWVRS